MQISIIVLGSRKGRRGVFASDFDDVWYDFLGRYVSLMREGGYAVPVDLTTRWEAFRELPQEVKDYVNSRGNIYDADWLRPGAREVYTEIEKNMGDLHFCTATMRKWADSKIELVDRVFGECARHKMCIMRDKDLLISDCLIEDNTQTLRKYRSRDIGEPILFDVGRADTVNAEWEMTAKSLWDLPELLEKVLTGG